MHQKPDHFEIALIMASKLHGSRRIVCASHGDFMTCCRAFYPIANGKNPFPLPPDVVLPIETVDATLTLDAVLPGGGIVPCILFEQTLHTAKIRTKIKWPEPSSDDLPERIMFCPDFSGVCVQDQDSAVIGAYDFFLDYLPNDQQLRTLSDEIREWQDLYEDGVHIDPKNNTSFDWEDFHAKGIAVCDKVQQLLGRRSQVFYRRITELPPPNDENSLVVFLPD